MNLDAFRSIARLVARIYNPPPPPAEVPREAMWSRIRLARDYNRLDQPVPRETMWNRLLQLRQPRRPRRILLRPNLAALGSGAHNRNGGRAGRWRSRGGWMIAPAALLAASVLVGVLRVNSGDAPEAPVIQTAGLDQGGVELVAGSGDRGWASLDARTGSFPSAFTRSMRLQLAGAATDGWYFAVRDDPVNEAYKRAAVQHMRTSITVLTSFEELAVITAPDRRMQTTVKELLSTTRLLMDSRVPARTTFLPVLEDLELVLGRISLISASTAQEDVELVKKALEKSKLLERMRDLIPNNFATANAN